MSKFTSIAGLAAMSTSVLLALACQPDASRALATPDLVERNAVYTIEDGRVLRITAYRGQSPILGQCVTDQTYALASGSCVEPGDTPPRLEAAILDKQGFRVASRLLSVESQAAVAAAGQTVDATVSVVSHRLFIEWNRYRVYSVDPYEISNQDPAQAYVSAIEYGIGLRIILDVRLTNVNAETNLNFGFGQVAASVATGNAQVDVQYDTIGIAHDILPDDMPVSIESVNDITRMLTGLHEAVEKVSGEWGDIVENNTGSNFLVPVTNLTEARPAATRGMSNPDGAGDSVDGGLESAPDDPAAPAPADTVSAAEVDALVGDIKTAREEMTSIAASNRTNKRLIGPLLNDDGPILGGPEFAEIEAASSRGEALTAAQQQSLAASLTEHYQKLAKLEDQATNLLSALPDTVRTSEQVMGTYRRYYPLMQGTDALIPRGFSAAPIAYYVTRTPTDMERDYCEDLRLHYALSRRQVDAQARAECGAYWYDNYSPAKLKEDYCMTKLLDWSTRERLPPRRLRELCGWQDE